MTQTDMGLPEQVEDRAMRLAREDVAIAVEVASLEPDEGRDLELELMWLAGYAQALRDSRQGLAAGQEDR